VHDSRDCKWCEGPPSGVKAPPPATVAKPAFRRPLSRARHVHCRFHERGQQSSQAANGPNRSSLAHVRGSTQATLPVTPGQDAAAVSVSPGHALALGSSRVLVVDGAVQGRPCNVAACLGVTPRGLMLYKVLVDEAPSAHRYFDRAPNLLCVLPTFIDTRASIANEIVGAIGDSQRDLGPVLAPIPVDTRVGRVWPDGRPFSRTLLRRAPPSRTAHSRP